MLLTYDGKNLDKNMEIPNFPIGRDIKTCFLETLVAIISVLGSIKFGYRN